MSLEIKLWETQVPDANLYPEDEANKGLPTLTPYLIEDEKVRPGLIVCPGGGFQELAAHEGEPVAKWLNSIGVNAFVLNYRIEPYSPITSLKDAARAVRLVRYHAERFRIDPNRLGMLGFSAGGYLTACLGTSLDNSHIWPGSKGERLISLIFGERNPADPIDGTSAKLNAMILCYSKLAVKQDAVDLTDIPSGMTIDEFLKIASTQNHISEKTPPTFIWATADDEMHCATENMHFAEGLAKHHVPYEMHVFAKGGHGLGMGEGEPAVKEWPGLCGDWLRRIWGE